MDHFTHHLRGPITYPCCDLLLYQYIYMPYCSIIGDERGSCPWSNPPTRLAQIKPPAALEIWELRRDAETEVRLEGAICQSSFAHSRQQSWQEHGAPYCSNKVSLCPITYLPANVCLTVWFIVPNYHIMTVECLRTARSTALSLYSRS